MFRRLFARPKSDDFLPADESAKPTALGADNEPPLLMLLPAFAGVTTYDLRRFGEAHSAAAFLESSRPAAFYREGVIAFWALHAMPAAVPAAECAVLIRAASEDELFHAYAFVDLDTALSYVRFRVEENNEPLHNFLVYWSVPVSIAANPSGEVRIEPSVPPQPQGDASSVTPSLIDEPPPLVEPEAPVEEVEADSATLPREAAEQPPEPALNAPDSADRLPESASAFAKPSGEPIQELIPETPASPLPPPAETSKPHRKMSFRVRSKALQLGTEGRSGRDIERELLATFPRDRVPSHRTINRWLRDAGTGRATDRRFEAMRKRVMDVLEDRLDEIADLSLAEVARVAALIERMRHRH